MLPVINRLGCTEIRTSVSLSVYRVSGYLNAFVSLIHLPRLAIAIQELNSRGSCELMSNTIFCGQRVSHVADNVEQLKASKCTTELYCAGFVSRFSFLSIIQRLGNNNNKPISHSTYEALNDPATPRKFRSPSSEKERIANKKGRK